MSVTEMRTQIVSVLEDAWAQLSPLLEEWKELLPDVSTVDPATRVAGAFATGLVLGKVVNRVGR